MTLAPPQIVHADVCLLADVRMLLSRAPEVADCPERLAALLGAAEYDIRAVLEALEVEGQVLP